MSLTSLSAVVGGEYFTRSVSLLALNHSSMSRRVSSRTIYKKCDVKTSSGGKNATSSTSVRSSPTESSKFITSKIIIKFIACHLNIYYNILIRPYFLGCICKYHIAVRTTQWMKSRWLDKRTLIDLSLTLQSLLEKFWWQTCNRNDNGTCNNNTISSQNAGSMPKPNNQRQKPRWHSGNNR